MARKISIEFASSSDTIYTARAGLAPINEVAKKLKLPQVINQACSGVRDDRYTTYEASEIVLFGAYGHLAGLHRTDQLLKSSEFPFLAKLSGLDREKPADTTFARFYQGFEEEHIQSFKDINLDLATKFPTEVSGHQIIVHDQSAIQKYGTSMEGVEKGYGGTLKKGSLMLQCSMIADAGSHSILSLDIRSGSTYSSNKAAKELDYVLSNLDKVEAWKRLVLADSAYGIGEYMRKCEEHKSSFILAVKNDGWMKNEMDELDFQRFNRGQRDSQYGYREFDADRDVWLGKGQGELFNESWDGQRRVVVVKLPVGDKDKPKYQFLVTNMDTDRYSAEEIHEIYRKNRETIDQINDEMKNQIGLNDLPSKYLLANRAMGQVVALAWNLQRLIEQVGMAEERKDENIRRAKMNIPESRRTQKRFEWWSMFIRFISIGGKVKTGGNKVSVIVGQCQYLMRWIKALTTFDWKAYAIAA